MCTLEWIMFSANFAFIIAEGICTRRIKKYTENKTFYT